MKRIPKKDLEKIGFVNSLNDYEDCRCEELENVVFMVWNDNDVREFLPRYIREEFEALDMNKIAEQALTHSEKQEEVCECGSTKPNGICDCYKEEACKQNNEHIFNHKCICINCGVTKLAVECFGYGMTITNRWTNIKRTINPNSNWLKCKPIKE